MSRAHRYSFAVAKSIALVIAVVIAFFPIFWMVSTSFKPLPEWSTYPPVWIPREPTLDNYLILINPQAVAGKAAAINYKVSETAWRPLFNSLVISTIATLLSVTFGTLAAYSIARFRVGGESYPFTILTVRMFPPIAVAIPMIVMFSVLRLADTYFGLIIAYTAFTLPFSIWMIRSFIEEVPTELEEAAVVHGMSTLGAFRRITLPLVRGGILATALFVYILNWSEFLFALVLTYGKVTTVTVQVSKYFSASSGRLYGPQAALGTISTLPVILFGYLIQRHIVRGLTFGAIKR
jgi:multiple sugar transport system permease protein